MLTEIRKEKDKPGYSWYKCQCGKEKLIRRNAVTSGKTKSCGCHRKRVAAQNGKSKTSHNMTNTDVYRYWSDLKRKVRVCKRWNDFNSFYEDVGKAYKKGLQLYTDDQVYGPDNCRWIPSLESRRLRRKKTSIQKYGVESPTKSSIVKEKIKQSNLANYGCEFPSKLDAVKDKARKTNIERYGVPAYPMSEEGREKSRGRARKIRGKTSDEWSKDIGISTSYFNILVREYGVDYALSHTKSSTAIEQSVSKILDSLKVNYEEQYKVENRIADFFLPDHNIIIEADGLYWHSDAVNPDRLYHAKKKALYDEHNFSSYFFLEDEIVNSGNIVKSIIANKLGLSERVFARKCSLATMNLKERKLFFSENHLMGCGRGKCYSLVSSGVPVAAIQYTNRGGTVDISRFCTKLGTSVVGGFSRLLSAVEKEESPDKIINFVDKRYGTGEHLSNFGFSLERTTVGFSWVKNMERVHRMRFPGNSGYDNGYYKLHDCGQAKFVKVL